jgi:putative tryptophan/tyrosine transport system substrate-binding protein
MKRREFIAGLGSAAAWPLAVRAQQPTQRMRRVGMLNGFDGNNPLFRSYVAQTMQALSQLGWEVGRNVEFIERWSGGDADRAAAMAKELVALRPDVIFTEAQLATAAVHRETRSIPIVFLDSDPVGSGLVASLAHPGGNLTGVAFSEETFAGKLLSLLRSAAPRIERAAVMLNPDNAGRSAVYHVDAFQTAARALAIEPITARVRSDDDIEQVITSLGRERGGLVAVPNGFINVHRATVIASSLRNGVPVIFDGTNFAKQGGLLQYGPDFPALQRRLAYYLDRILRGTKPSELAVELPVKYLFVINLKTAKAIGLDVSADMISIADEVIE